MASKSVIFLKRSDAPVHSAGGTKLLWEPYAPRFSTVKVTEKEAIEALRKQVKSGIGAITEVTEEELEEEKKNLRIPEPQVHQDPDMRAGLSHERSNTKTFQQDVADNESDEPSDSPKPKKKAEHEPVRHKPSTAKRSDVEDAPQ